MATNQHATTHSPSKPPADAGHFQQTHGDLHHEHTVGTASADGSSEPPPEPTPEQKKADALKKAQIGLQKQIDIQIANIASAPDEPARVHEAAAQLTYLQEAMRAINAEASSSGASTQPAHGGTDQPTHSRG